jgi:hypothetical protein
MTVGVQRSWSADYMRRWRAVQQASSAAYARIFENEFSFRAMKADAEDIRRFMVEFDRALQENLSGDWQDEYVDASYDRGMRDGSRALRNAGITTAIMGAGALATRRQTPANVDRVLILRNTAKDEATGIASATSQQVARVLRDGVAANTPKRELLAGVNGRIEHIGRTRSKITAKTEPVRSHHKAKLQMYKDENVEEVTVEVEWVLGSNPCPICIGLSSKTYTISEIEGMIPVHPSCECSTVPVNKQQAA